MSGSEFVGPNQPETARILAGLNREQQAAVTGGDGPSLIVAGAGTGKTKVITHRVAYLIACGRAQPDEVLALTFTEKAAQEMEERVDLLLPYGWTQVWIGTFHAFGQMILKEHGLEIGLPPDVRVLSWPEQVIFFRDRLFQLSLSRYRPLGNPTRHVEALLRLMSRAKDEDVSPQDYLEYARRLQRSADASAADEELQDHAAREAELAAVYAEYQDALKRAGRVDFGDLITQPLALFRDRPSVLKVYQERFRYILVDEFQDTNYAQFELVKLLAGARSNITVVGDDDQSIYKFRGAAISNILSFMDTYPQASRIVLTRNYRSRAVILESAYRFITHNNPDRLEYQQEIDKRLRPQNTGTGVVRYVPFDTLFAQAEGVADLVRDQVNKKGRRFGECAILVRSNNDADPYLRALNLADIPWQFSGNEGLYDREEVKTLISFARVATDFHDSMSLYHVATSEVYALPTEPLVLAMSTARRTNRSLYSVLVHLTEIPELDEELDTSVREVLQNLVEEMRYYAHLATRVTTGEAFYTFLTRSGYLERLTSGDCIGAEDKLRNIARFFDRVRAIGPVLEHDHLMPFARYLDLLIEAGDNPAVAEADLAEDAVNVLTVHKAKGLEFPVVIMVDLVTNRFPSRARREAIPLPEELIKDVLPAGDFHLQEERRLFYVGMTRAEEELYFTSAVDYGGKRPRRVSPFVGEALGEAVHLETLRRASPVEVIERCAPPAHSEPQETPPIPDGQIVTLSHFQIDDYLTCPLKYKYVHVLRVPILQNHAVVYGKALHEAVSEFYRAQLRGEALEEDLLIQMFEHAWISEGFMSREHEQLRLEAGRRTLSRFYREALKATFVPRFVEKEFGFMLDRDRIVGRWDLVKEDQGKIAIVDFKSSEIREQTKANRRARESLQLALYALAYTHSFGQPPDSLELHFLDTGIVGCTAPTERSLQRTVEQIKDASQGIRAGDFAPRPGYLSCRYCVYRTICTHRRRR